MIALPASSQEDDALRYEVLGGNYPFLIFNPFSLMYSRLGDDAARFTERGADTLFNSQGGAGQITRVQTGSRDVSSGRAFKQLLYLARGQLSQVTAEERVVTFSACFRPSSLCTIRVISADRSF